ncbi:hypothetical protein N6L27_07375 [Leisingera sp. SS27]|uniref:hypothetical protein n=1 Tax=Leisingera sp. SS27 TaxID=2979462 RepID=UPI00232D5A8A|nr:hypothetical protein [Leisingera sp. SS27]MDC0657808.1 hypothetical protein [Leisingera sp. SS27]
MDMVKVAFSADPQRQNWLYVKAATGSWHSCSRRRIRVAFNRAENLKQLAEWLGVSPMMVRRILTIAGIDFVRRLYSIYMSGNSCEHLAAQNGMKPATLSKLFKNKGFSVKRGRPYVQLPREQADQAWRCTGTVNSFARALNLHWKTAKNIHQEHALPKPSLKYRRFECYALEVRPP